MLPANPTRPNPNAFDLAFLDDLDGMEDPPTSGDPVPIPMLRMEELPNGTFALYRHRTDPQNGIEPFAVFQDQEYDLAVMAAGVIPLMTSNRAYWMRKSQTSKPGMELCRYGRAVGRLRNLDEETLAALNFCDALIRSAESMTALIESAGAPVLRPAGVKLARRLKRRIALMLEKQAALQAAALIPSPPPPLPRK